MSKKKKATKKKATRKAAGKKKAPAAAGKKKATRKAAGKKKATKKKATKKAAPRALPKEGLSMRAYAKRRKDRGLPGGTHPAVRDAIIDGRLTSRSVTQIGRRTIIEPELADKEWEENTVAGQVRDPKKVSKGRKAAAAKKREETAADASSQQSLFGLAPEKKPDRAKVADEDDETTTAESSRAGSYFGALLKKLEYEQKAGDLVKKEAVDTETFSAFRAVRDRLLGIPDRIGSILAAETDVATVRARLLDELLECLETLSNDLQR